MSTLAAAKRAKVQRVADRDEQRLSVAKGYLVVHENVAFLERPLRNENFNVVSAPKGLKNDNIKKMLGNRVWVTKNDKNFQEDAAKYDYGIISLRDLRFVDRAPENNQTAQRIAKAWTKYNLTMERFRFLLTLKPNGRHTFERLS